MGGKCGCAARGGEAWCEPREGPRLAMWWAFPVSELARPRTRSQRSHTYKAGAARFAPHATHAPFQRCGCGYGALPEGACRPPTRGAAPSHLIITPRTFLIRPLPPHQSGRAPRRLAGDEGEPPGFAPCTLGRGKDGDPATFFARRRYGYSDMITLPTLTKESILENLSRRSRCRPPPARRPPPPGRRPRRLRRARDGVSSARAPARRFAAAHSRFARVRHRSTRWCTRTWATSSCRSTRSRTPGASARGSARSTRARRGGRCRRTSTRSSTTRTTR